MVRKWRDAHPDEAIPDGLALTQPWPSTSAEKARGVPHRVIYYQYRHDRARRTLRGIDEQVRKAERAVDGHAPVKRNRYIHLSGATKSVNRTLEAKTRALAGWKGYADVGVMPTGGVCCLVGGRGGAGFIGIMTDSWSERHPGLPCNSGGRGYQQSNSDGSGGRELRLVLAVNDFEHFLSARKGLSVSTRECYVRHVLAFLTEVGGEAPPVWSTSAVCQLSACVRT